MKTIYDITTGEVTQVALTTEEQSQKDAEKTASWGHDADSWNAVVMREERNLKLQATDWTQMPDYNGSNKSAWATYRQALRDVPAQSGFPNDITWPTEPS